MNVQNKLKSSNVYTNWRVNEGANPYNGLLFGNTRDLNSNRRQRPKPLNWKEANNKKDHKKIVVV